MSIRSYMPNFRSLKSRGLSPHPVMGGRGFVRKTPYYNTSQAMTNYLFDQWPNKPWRAWTNGLAKKHNRYFSTQREAMAWMQLVLQVFPQAPWISKAEMQKLFFIVSREPKVNWIVVRDPRRDIWNRGQIAIFLKGNREYRKYKEKR